MEREFDIWDKLIEGLFRMSPEEFDRKCIEDHTKEVKQLLEEYDATDPWRFIKRASILREVGRHTRQIEWHKEDLKKRRCEVDAG